MLCLLFVYLIGDAKRYVSFFYTIINNQQQ
jgi:hypothetical protein